MSRLGSVRRSIAMLRAYAIIWVAAALLALLGIVAAYSYTAYRSAATELVIERDLQLAYLSAARLEDELSKFSDTLEDLARTDGMRSNDVELQTATLSESRLGLSAFDAGVVLLDGAGRIQAAQPERPLDIGRDWSDRAYFRSLLTAADVVFGDTEIDGPGDTSAVVVAVPIHGGSGELLGALVGMFRLGQATISPFYASIVRLRIGQSGDTYLVGSRRQILYDSGVKYVGQPFSSRALPDVTLGPRGGAIRTRDVEGHDVLAAYVPVPGTPWWLVTEDDWATLTRTTRQYIRIFFAVVGLGMFVPLIGVALLARRQRTDVMDRGREDYETRVAQLIQSALLPEGVPWLPGWRITAEFRPADVGPCAFYDWRLLPDSDLTITLADVTEKRAAAVTIMATARAALRGADSRGLEPCAALEEANLLLCEDMPEGIAVSCLHARLDPRSGVLQYATAGHAAPLQNSPEGVVVHEATGRRLGVDVGRSYETRSFTIPPGRCALFCSAGLLDAHNAAGERFGDARLSAIAREHDSAGRELARAILADFSDFMGGGWQPDADMTLILVERLEGGDQLEEFDDGGG